jgi:hypothetical protein
MALVSYSVFLRSMTTGLALLSLFNPVLSGHDPEELPLSDTLIIQDAPGFVYRTTFLSNSSQSGAESSASFSGTQIPIDGYSKHAEIQVEGVRWSVYEDLRSRDGHIIFASVDGHQRVFPKTAEASFWQESSKYPRNLGLKMSDVGMNLRDLLADRLLEEGEPIEEKVAAIIPPLGSLRPGAPGGPASWTSFVGNVHANDNAPIFGYGNTRSYQPIQKFPLKSSRQRWEGYVGGWMPAVRKIHPVSATDYTELIIFGDVDAPDPFIIQTWHRTAQVLNGKITKVLYGKSYPEFRPTKLNPKAEEFYTALFRFGNYWQKHLGDIAPLTLPDPSWAYMAKYALAKELMVRPGGVYPKYGAIDRDYYGSEYDGFQDIFTSSLSTNLDWGRFKQCYDVIDNYFTLFVSPSGAINMRGPEMGQFGLTLALLAKYVKYTGETALLTKHKDKIVATANSLVTLHDESLRLPKNDPGHGLIHGWSESDACLKGNPDVYWKPYFANSALSARGLKDIASLPMFQEHSHEWQRRAQQLINRTVESMETSVLHNRNPPYMPPLPGTNKTFRESMATDRPSSQDWPHRLYAELLHAAVLPEKIANHVHDTMRSYGSTSIGVVANVGVPNTATRDILGFISYGHAYSLLLLDRVDEFILFMYTHRYHVHSRGAWNGVEVSGLNGDQGTFCIPAQLTIPNIVRWALVLEHPDHDILYLGRGVPRAWLDTGREISIKKAPTRWGLVDYEIRLDKSAGVVKATVRFERGAPKQIEVKLRAPKGKRVANVSVHGQPARLQNNEAVTVTVNGGVKEIIVEARLV